MRWNQIERNLIFVYICLCSNQCRALCAPNTSHAKIVAQTNVYSSGVFWGLVGKMFPKRATFKFPRIWKLWRSILVNRIAYEFQVSFLGGLSMFFYLHKTGNQTHRLCVTVCEFLITAEFSKVWYALVIAYITYFIFYLDLIWLNSTKLL